MANIVRYQATDRMSDLISDNYSLLMVMSRFGLSLGFGDKTVAEVCEDGIREQIRLDIGAGRGARRTPLYFLSEGTYKSRKRDTKWRIAEELKLL
jgi:hypothetical protein